VRLFGGYSPSSYTFASLKSLVQPQIVISRRQKPKPNRISLPAHWFVKVNLRSVDCRHISWQRLVGFVKYRHQNFKRPSSVCAITSLRANGNLS
jgi:hypothetical protein